MRVFTARRLVLVLEKPWFTWKVTVRDSDGRTIGVIGRELGVGKPVYALTAHGGAEVGEIRRRALAVTQVRGC